MGPVLDNHIRSTLFGVSLVVGLALTGISGFITLVEQLDDLGEGGFGLWQVLQVTGLKMPEVTYELFPLIVLLGTIMGLGSLAAGGELVVIQAAGVSLLRIAWSAVKGGIVLGLIAVLLGDVLVPGSRALADGIRNKARYGEVEFSSRAVWLREGQNYIRIGRLPSEDRLEDVQSWVIDRESRRLLRTLSMAEAVYGPGGWVGSDVRATLITPTGVEVSRSPSAAWKVDIDPELLKLFVLRADSLSILGLHRYIGYLDANGLDATGPRYAFWRKISLPLTVLVMALLAVPFVLGPLRDTGAGQRLFIGVMVGIGFYLVNEVTASVGQVYGLSAPMAALAPTVLLAAIAVWRLLHHGSGRA